MRASHLLDEPPDPDAVRSYLADERNVFFLAEEKGRAVGFLRGTAFGQLKSTRNQMFLYEIEVESGHRRLGIGTELVQRLIAYCQEREFEEIFVFTDPSNVAAVSLYRSTGAVTETPADRMFVYQLLGTTGVATP
ncbi:MAG: GNAT family N-acetyltransferase [Thermoplasmata archaeon]|nr:GNAT family N-acetyltransferase [Thermoplasmata archaeon]